MANTEKKKDIKRKELVGTVVSKKTAKTLVVETIVLHRHPLYRKAVRKTQRYLVHDPEETGVVGAKITIVASRPISKMKHFIVKNLKG